MKRKVDSLGHPSSVGPLAAVFPSGQQPNSVSQHFKVIPWKEKSHCQHIRRERLYKVIVFIKTNLGPLTKESRLVTVVNCKKR